MAPELPIRSFRSRGDLDRWLAKQHDRSPGIWLKLAKKGSGIRSLTYPDALEVALSFGWIDGQTKKFDGDWYVQRFTPRRARSRWSKINRAKATALVEQGAMHPAGLAEVERAKADGRWDAAYDSPRTATMHADLERALTQDARARACFDTLDSRNRYAILYQVQDAKRPETRARRIEKFVAMLRRGAKPYP